MSFFNTFMKGVLIGTAMVTPGLSGGVVAVVLGVYDKLIFSLINFFKDFRKNFKFLLIITFGILFGAVWFGKILMFLISRHEVITKLTFMGLILGTVPSLINEVKEENGKINYKILFLTLLFSFTLYFFKENLVSMFNTDKLVYIFIAGTIYSIGKVIPGISSSFLLILIGKYEFSLSLISNPIIFTINNFKQVLFFVLGFVIGVGILLNVINKLLNNKKVLLYSVITGFVIGSTPALIPMNVELKKLIIGLLFLGFSFVLSYKLTKK